MTDLSSKNVDINLSKKSDVKRKEQENFPKPNCALVKDMSDDLVVKSEPEPYDDPLSVSNSNSEISTYLKLEFSCENTPSTTSENLGEEDEEMEELKCKLNELDDQKHPDKDEKLSMSKEKNTLNCPTCNQKDALTLKNPGWWGVESRLWPFDCLPSLV